MECRDTCQILLQKLKEGQEDLRNSLIELQPYEELSQKHVHKRKRSHIHRHGDPLCCVERLPRRRARIDQLSPESTPIVTGRWWRGKSSGNQRKQHKRRRSSTPRHSVNSLPDLSLEEALLSEENRGKEGERREEPTSRRRKMKEKGEEEHSVQPHLSLSKVARSSASIRSRDKSVKRKSRGLTVSFVTGQSPSRPSEEDSCSSLHTGEANKLSFTEEKKKGSHLIASLNSSRFGALEHRLPHTQQAHKVPRQRRWVCEDPQLGYDWIAGIVDSGSYLEDKDDEYFDEMLEFRRVNHSECSRPSVGFLPDSNENSSRVPPSPSSLLPPTSTTITPHIHCTESYTLNNRLFPVPLHPACQPATNCPVCEGRPEREGKKEPERFIRVSVPRCSLQMSYQPRLHRRRSFDPSDSMALSKHCLVGWDAAKPSSVPPQRSLNLKSALLPQSTESSRLKSQDLLNVSHSLEYSLRSRSHRKK